MEINIHFVKMQTSETMEAFAIKKLNKLAKHYDWIIKADVSYKLENDPRNKGRICEMLLSAPGPRLFAKSIAGNFEKATDQTIRDLEMQLKKRKAAMRPHLK